jgi:hypothetical protein
MCSYCCKCFWVLPLNFCTAFVMNWQPRVGGWHWFETTPWVQFPGLPLHFMAEEMKLKPRERQWWARFRTAVACCLGWMDRTGSGESRQSRWSWACSVGQLVSLCYFLLSESWSCSKPLKYRIAQRAQKPGQTYWAFATTSESTAAGKGAYQWQR